MAETCGTPFLVTQSRKRTPTACVLRECCSKRKQTDDVRRLTDVQAFNTWDQGRGRGRPPCRLTKRVAHQRASHPEQAQEKAGVQMRGP